MNYKIFTVFSLFLIIGCKSAQENKASDLEYLVKIMQGTYSSEKQSITDEEYFNISLRMIPIWKEKGNYLYVEQAMFEKQESPYRVRIYKVSQRNNEFVSEIYTLKNEKEWIGKWKTPEAFDTLSESDIELKPGCEVILKKQTDGTFIGQTGEKTCLSELRGASYASSKVTVTPTQILSWDQGFDKDGKQVWGAIKGGYVFDKIN
ncbi:MAG TPA: chromophore lyase CpcT/CpeT [Flavobacterium sp.]|uniref:chromophore lyase CpcT/CpeT n=1 Tax=unclassified Flavobacterium TaxID=196869 RepID=UPI0025C2DFBC|nr:MULTISPECIES: chromophore lyase CpcT/CpeT [unclassified Flavobacterium]HRE78372.1 chromophore lyase CpcT/CpeT [Flavobacterium sp.]